MTTKINSGEFVVPPVTEINPTLGALRAKAAPLGAERSALSAEDLELARAPDEADSTGDKVRARAAAILGRAPPSVAGSRTERRAAIAERIRDIDHALAVLNSEIRTEQNRSSSLMTERAMPHYKQKISEMAAALISVHTVQTAIIGLVNKLQAEGYSSGDFGNHLPYWIDRDLSSNGSIPRALREFVSDGLLPASSVPAGLR